MQNPLLKFILFSTVLSVTTANADNYVCPGSYQTIMTGYTIDQVTAACGKPANVTSQEQLSPVPLKLEQWVYTLPTNKQNNTRPSPNSPQLIITFDNEKVAEITMNNQAAAVIFPCYSNNKVTVGTPKNDVRQQCGFPSFVNTLQRANNKPIQVIQWTYNYGRFQPQIIVTFTDGKVTEIRTGQLGN